MAMRRPRIKVQANIQLNSKRKSKVADTKSKDSESIDFGEKKNNDEINSIQEINTNEDIVVTQKQEFVSDESSVLNDTTADKTNLPSIENAEDDTIEEEWVDEVGGTDSKNSVSAGIKPKNEPLSTDADAFKCPPKHYQRAISHSSNNGADDVFYSDIEENVIQMDLQKSSNDLTMSPSKNQVRQRIKATPIFGQRRNSFVGSSPSPHTSANEDNQSNNSNDFAVPSHRRERHLSASHSVNSNSSSSSYHHHTPHKYLPNGVLNAGMGRVRTESGCSVFSDTNVSTHKSRKTDELKNIKRDFEARFQNGVPDKSALKMSDLIYYNPATNPMEQKPNPNVKQEHSDNSNSDIKPFKEKKEKHGDNGDDPTEAMPVPQLKLNSNGELILDDKSLVIETTAEQEARKVLANSSLIYLDENTGMNGFYSRQKRTRDWPSSETIKFYRCLQTVGTDFSLMVPLFPNRTRRDLKLKFKKEERINGNLINKALLYPKQFNIEDLKQQIEEEEKQREEEAKHYKQLKEAAAKETKKRKSVRSSSDTTLNGKNIYQNENEQKPKKTRNSKTKVPKPETVASPKIVPTLETNSKCDSNVENTNAVIIENTSSLEVTIPDTKFSTKTIKIENDKVKRRRRRGPNIPKQISSGPQQIASVPQQSSSVPQQISSVSQQISPVPQQISSVSQQVPSVPQQIEDTAQSIKLEKVKSEPFVSYVNAKTEIFNDTDQIASDDNELLHSDKMEMHYVDSMPLEASPELTSPQPPAISQSPISSDSSSMLFIDEDNYCNEPMEIDTTCYEGRTFMNLDDGSVTTINDVNVQKTPAQTMYKHEQEIICQPTPSPSPPSSIEASTITTTSMPASADLYNHAPRTPKSHITSQPDLVCNDTCSSIMSERELNEQDIEQILTELAEGSLVLVSTLDPEDPDKVLNEIFMVNQNTGDLCDEPLNIPDNIVQCILSVMS